MYVMAEFTADPLAKFRRVNINTTLNMAQQAAVAGVRRFVFVSAVRVHDEATLPAQSFADSDSHAPLAPYSNSKREPELGLRQSAAYTSLDVVIIRPAMVYGPEVKVSFAALRRAVQRGLPLPLGAVHNKRSLLALDNLVELIVTFLQHLAASNLTLSVGDGQTIHFYSPTGAWHGEARGWGACAMVCCVVVGLAGIGWCVGKGVTVRRMCGNLQVDTSKAPRRWVGSCL
jgi:nucleoside-diphosphate-sugar epimerase